MKKVIVAALSLVTIAALGADEKPTVPREQKGYWFESPAKDWNAALPLGNGRLGAMIFGEPGKERILLNETSVWEPPKPRLINPKGPQLLPEIRKLIFEGKRIEAEQMTEKEFLIGRDAVSSYQPLANLWITHEGKGEVSGYSRRIHLDSGLACVDYKRDGIRHHRESFVSYDNDVIALSYTADKSKSISFTLKADRPANYAVEVTPPNSLRLMGSTGKNGVRFEMLLRVNAQGGEVTVDTQALTVKNADAVTITIASYTDYNFASPRHPLTDNLHQKCRDALDSALVYPELRERQIVTFSDLYNRVSYGFDCKDGSSEPLEKRLAEVKKKKRCDLDFLLLYNDFCRYLLISSSRRGGLPANLQGIWNPHLKAPWNSDWHLDINLSMHYWPAGAWGLSELAEPLISLAAMGLEESRETARVMMGTEAGRPCGFLGTCTDVWGTAEPFRHTYWGMYVGGGAWLLQDALETWRYTGDEAYLERIQPLLRMQSAFFLSWMVKNPTTEKWVSGPSVSPENSYRYQGKNAAVDMGPAHDQELIFATFRDLLDVADYFDTHDQLTHQVATALRDLAMPAVDSRGAIMEWSEPLDEAEPAHRHLSHLYGMSPGNRISRHRTPALAAAVKKSMELRMGAGYRCTGWLSGVMGTLWARQGDGLKAWESIQSGMPLRTDALFSKDYSAEQISDMMGIPNAFNEMLLQSQSNEIELLPALPEQLKNGSFRGLRARGGFIVDADWINGKVTSLKVTSQNGGVCRLRCNGKTMEFTTVKNGTFTLFSP